MNPQNSGPDCILSHDLKVLLRQSFNSLFQVSVVACSSLLRQYLFLQHIYSVMTKFPLSRQIFLCLFNTLSCKVYRSIHSMWRRSHVCLLEQLCGDIDNCVATLFLCSFFNFVSRPRFYAMTVFLLVLVATMFLVLSAFLSRPGKSIATESCLHLTWFLIAASL